MRNSQQPGERPPQPVRFEVRLGSAAATRASDGLGIGLPFPPAAERCAFAVMVSISCAPPDVAWARLGDMACRMPRCDHRWLRL
jgi:hypothetical protein